MKNFFFHTYKFERKDFSPEKLSFENLILFKQLIICDYSPKMLQYIDYSRSSCFALLELTLKHKPEFLSKINFYAFSKNDILVTVKVYGNRFLNKLNFHILEDWDAYWLALHCQEIKLPPIIKEKIKNSKDKTIRNILRDYI